MRRLFRSFEQAGLEYLLISGQATVLYGAATFSEDVDIWIRPTRENGARLLRALARCRARVYRLTPRLTPRNLRAGHGFHFVVPDRPLDTYLDVMGRPPRVGTFVAARRRARSIRTAWGTLPVVHPLDLVEVKKTRRLADYDVITNLVVLHLAETKQPGRGLLRWAARNAFRAEERAAILGRLGRSVTADGCAAAVSRDVATLQAKDRAYWSRIVDDLRTMRRDGKLLPDDLEVAALD